MDTSSPTINNILFIVCGFMFAVPCLFFAVYTARLVHLILTMENSAGRWSSEILMAAIGFPLATIILGVISWFYFNKARRGVREK